MQTLPPAPPPALAGRLAPSPTGLLHLGHARTFLVAWWQARSLGARLLLRIEDLDRSRVRPQFVDAILRDLEWLGLDWDGPVVHQSERLELYAEALARLAALGLAYPCVCTRREIELAASAPHEGDGTLLYPGTCRGLYPSLAAAEHATSRRAAYRFHTPPGSVPFTDLLHGAQSHDVAATIGDFPLTSRDGTYAYQLAVVVDDQAQGITHVTRGADLLSSTARQVLLQDSLSLARPSYLHLPLVHSSSGDRLAKRTDSLALQTLREAHLDPRQIVRWALHSLSLPAPPLLTAREALSSFTLSHLTTTPLTLPENPFPLQSTP